MERSIKGDYIGFTFGDVHSSELGLVRVSDGSRYSTDLLPPLEDKVAQVAGRDGEVLFGTTYKAKEIKVPVAFDNMTEESFKRLTQLLADKKPKSLWFDESPYKELIVKSANVQDFKWVCFDESQNIARKNDGDPVSTKKRIYKGEGTLIFKCRSPYAQSRVTYLDDPVDYVYIKDGHKIVKKESYGKFSLYSNWNKGTVNFGKSKEFFLKNKNPYESLKKHIKTEYKEEGICGQVCYYDDENSWFYTGHNEQITQLPKDMFFFSTNTPTTFWNMDDKSTEVVECSISILTNFSEETASVWEGIKNEDGTDKKFYIRQEFISKEEYEEKYKEGPSLFYTNIYLDKGCTQKAYTKGIMLISEPYNSKFRLIRGTVLAIEDENYFQNKSKYLDIIIPDSIFISTLKDNYNFEEWKEASGLVLKEGYETFRTNSRTMNSGDVEANFILTIKESKPWAEIMNAEGEVHFLIGGGTKKLILHKLEKVESECLQFDSKIKLIKGGTYDKENKKFLPDGKIYNFLIKKGDFFRLDIGETLFTSFPVAQGKAELLNFEHKHYYYV